MMTSSNGDISALLAIRAGKFTGLRRFDDFFDLRLNKRLTKQW